MRREPSRGSGWWLRRSALAAVILFQVTAVIAAYHTDQRPFGFQMFPESTDWQAEVVRVTGDSDRVGIAEEWPGGYRWRDLVPGRGLADPSVRHHADAGIRSTLDFLQGALDWVATHTPDDHETRHLEAVVTYWPNGGDPVELVLRSNGERREAP